MEFSRNPDVFVEELVLNFLFCFFKSSIYMLGILRIKYTSILKEIEFPIQNRLVIAEHKIA